MRLWKRWPTLLACLCVLVPAGALAAGPADDTLLLIEWQNRLDSESVHPRLTLTVDADLGPTWGILCFANVQGTEKYGEAYCGPSLDLLDKSLTLSVGFGLETSDDPWRVAGSVLFSRWGLNVLGVVGYGQSGLWHLAKATYSLGPFNLGLMSQRLDGEGLFLEINNGTFGIYSAVLYNIEQHVADGASGLDPDYLVGLIGISFAL